jgi:acyl carrier protein
MSTVQSEALAAVRDSIASLLQRSIETVTPEADLENDLGLDSLAMIELSVALEARFGVAMPPGASAADLSIRTVGDLGNFVGGLIASRQTGART